MRLREVLVPGLAAAPRALYPGAVALVLRDGDVLDAAVVGDAVRYGPGPRLLPPSERVAMRADTVFDTASLTKLITATVAMALVDGGLLDLDAPMVDHMPELTDDRHPVTMRRLLTHTSGLPALRRLWELPSRAARVDAVVHTRPTRPPGTGFEYSCVGYIVAGLLLERVAGAPLPDLVAALVTKPLGLADTGFRPVGDVAARAAATEWQPYVDRGVVRGSVHDENSWSLGGTAGNAGLFSTAPDLARFAEMLRRGGEFDGVRVISDDAVAAMTTDQLPAIMDPGYRQGIGPRIDDPVFMGTLAGRGAFGHTGFTGTSLVVDPSTATVVILLTNRVHPSREWSDIAPVRRAVADVASTA
ncbi:MAG: serine hydrolase domain-containing protein [Jiangellaceae bacterium]